MATVLPRNFPLRISLAVFVAAAMPAALATPRSVTIPLPCVNIGSSTFPQYKLGIYVGLGGGAPKLYEFDTGGQGFFAAGNAPWWTNFTVTGSGTVNPQYSSGISYTAQIVSTSVGLYASARDSAPVASANVNIGQILDATGGNPPKLNWGGYVTNPNAAPIYGSFYGDFGANLEPTPGTPANNIIYTILGQLPGNLSSGFILHMGSYAHPHPTLQLGLTAADRASFPVQLPLLGRNAAQAFPGSGFPTYGFFQTWGYAALNLKARAQEFPTEVILDTGAPSMTIRTGTSLAVHSAFVADKSLVNDTAISFSSGAWTLAFAAAEREGLNEVGVAASKNSQNLSGYINTGLNAFFANDVMYDVQNGVIGFRAVEALAAPVVKISGSTTIHTTRSSCRVKGSVRSAARVADVLYRRTDHAAVHSVEGRKNWRFVANLQTGKNVFHIHAVDKFDVAGPETSVVIFRD